MLSELTIVDLSEGVAGAFATKYFAGYGARVIKIERPGAGDPARRVGPFPDTPNPDAGGLFLYLNSNKESVTLDIATATGRRLLLELIEHADAVVESFPPGYLDSIGLGHDALMQRHPRLIVTSVTPFGRSGPYAGRNWTELTAYAAGGQHSLCGDVGKPPVMPAGHQGSYQAGIHAFGATLAGLHWTSFVEAGQSVEVAEMEVLTATLELYLPDYTYIGREILTKRRGNVISATIGVFPCADGYVGVHVMARNFGSFARIVGAEWMLEDEAYRTERDRLRQHDTVLAQVYAYAAEHTREEIYRRSGEERCTLAPVLSIPEVMQQPHLAEREFFRDLVDPRAGNLTYTGPPFRPGAGEFTVRPAPRLGEHNAAVFGELLELSSRELVQLRRARVI
jgi:crotonobetainyl-CoA:carnitine CoA-transferase CaiB-like acyl-CoA transferase